ncbi:holin [Paenibacillus sp. FSL E2-8871]|uniref:holin n=2 Tax=Paenibacillus TaxID=44249 RepID=UPI0030FAA8EB
METREILDDVMAFASILAVFVLALVQLVKNSINIPRNAVPIIGLLIGLLIGAAAYPFTELDIVLRLWAGGLAGLSATGLFELAFKDRPGTTKEIDNRYES